MRVGIPELSFVFCKLAGVTLKNIYHCCCNARLSTHEQVLQPVGVCPVSYEDRLCFVNCIDKIGNYIKISVVPAYPPTLNSCLVSLQFTPHTGLLPLSFAKMMSSS